MLHTFSSSIKKKCYNYTKKGELRLALHNDKTERLGQGVVSLDAFFFFSRSLATTWGSSSSSCIFQLTSLIENGSPTPIYVGVTVSPLNPLPARGPDSVFCCCHLSCLALPASESLSLQTRGGRAGSSPPPLELAAASGVRAGGGVGKRRR